MDSHPWLREAEGLRVLANFHRARAHENRAPADCCDNPAMLTQPVEEIQAAAFYPCTFCASPRLNPFEAEARDELGVRFGRQTAPLPSLKRPRMRFEPRTAFFPHTGSPKSAPTGQRGALQAFVPLAR